MAWTETTREHYRRDGLRYASDTTDAEWALIAPHLPPPARRGRPRRRKRHILTDTDGNLIAVVVHAADIQDRDGAPEVLASVRALCPWLRHVFADGGYAGDKLEDALLGKGRWTLEIVRRSDAAKGFVVIARRWVVERTFARLGRCRRLAKDDAVQRRAATSAIVFDFAPAANMSDLCNSGRSPMSPRIAPTPGLRDPGR